MKIFEKIPVDVENLIWEYTGLFKLRNGILISQIIKPPKIIEYFKHKKININITQTNIIVCAPICKKIKDILHVFKVIIYPNKIVYIYLTSSLSTEGSHNYLKNYETYETC